MGWVARFVRRQPKTPWDFIDVQRRELLKLDKAALNELQVAYARSMRESLRELELLIALMEKAMKKGEPIHPNWLWRQQRFESMIIQLARELRVFQADASEIVNRLGLESAYLGNTHAYSRMEMAGPTITFEQLPREAMDMMVAQLRSRTPLGGLINDIAQTAQQGLINEIRNAINEELTNGIALGRNPRDVARRMRKRTKDRVRNLSYGRAEKIARTESMRTYRAAQTANYRANDDVVTGWVWIAALSIFTCPACLARHMTVHPLSEDMESHIACRCTAMPMVDNEKPDLPFGDEWLKAQSKEDQISIMGSRVRWQWWKDGKISLEDMVQEKHNEKWGRSVHVKPLYKLRPIVNGKEKSKPNVTWNPGNNPTAGPE